jgi:protocatechuate 3,4-dioxygenase beta subunit
MTNLTRRSVLGLLGGAGAAALLAACSKDDDPATAASSTSSTSSTSTSTAAGAGLTEIPEETAGPFPGDGSNGPNALTTDGVVRRDITSSFGPMSGTAVGIPLAVTLTVKDATDGAPMAGAAVYAWQCDREGRYSLYSDGVEDQNYLRGVQVADGGGNLTFDSIFPGAYSGRWPHIHFEVYASEVDATAGAEPIATSQLALPEDVCNAAYAADGYEASVENMRSLSLESDGVFRDDGAAHQLAAVTGDPTSGYVATLTVPV